ncbi:MAG: recombination protein O N-terminal domain-containing protein [Muribaculaceae bacterium]|nr:recombination protein O N-terminal domain-containing protein [Muribaculaceae bacterium]
MKEKIRGILLQTLRHNDRHNIVTLYTESHGRVSFLSSASSGKVGKMRKAILSPLAIVEADVNFNSTRDLQFLGTVHVPGPWKNLYFDPDKISMTFFLSDFLTTLLRRAPEDRGLFHFLHSAIMSLDDTQYSVVNYHLCFMIRLLHFMGIEPDYQSYRPGYLFDMRDGSFIRSTMSTHNDLLDSQYSSVIPLLGRMTFYNHHRFRFSGEQRRIILNHLMRYYSIHLSIPTKLKSLDILHELYR